MVNTDDGTPRLSEMVRDDGVGIFKDRDLLKTSRIVGEERIVGRDEQMSTLVTLLKPLLHESSPPDILVYGPSGTGKSLITSRVVNEYKSALAEQDRDLAVVEINCQWLTSNFQACEKIAEEVSDLGRVGEEITVSGLSTHKALSETFNIVDDRYDAAIIIVDEIDLLVNPVKSEDEEPAFSALLYQLSRMDDLIGFDDMSVIALTNSPDFMRELDGRAESSFNPRDVHFPDYDANQLREILRKREDAFFPDVLGDDVVPLSAAFAAQDHGDARKAVDLLRTAGDEASAEDADMVREEHVRRAQEEVEKDRILEIAHGYSSGKKTVLLSAAVIQAWSSRDIEAIPSPVLKDVYDYICKAIDHDPKSKDTLLRYMGEFETNGLLDSSIKSRGLGSGIYKTFKLNRQPEYLVETLMERDNRFDAAMDKKDLVATKVDKALEDFYD